MQPLAPGDTLAEGRYELMAPLGSGGMAEVWRARDHRLGVERAIKLLALRHIRSGSAAVRFEREAKVMAHLEHPHVVPVHDIGQEGERHYLVMSILGGSLQDELEATGRIGAGRAVRMCIGVLDALTSAHAAGVVHRDVKPHNVLVDDRDEPRLTDFGIATDPSARGLTRTGAIMGTLAFMAPEQRASARQVDGRADVYAVGAMLFALCTGLDPTEIDHPDGRDERLAALPQALVPFVEQATRRRAADRFEDAADALAHLRDAAAVLPDVPELRPISGRAPRQEITGLTMDLDALGDADGQTGTTLTRPVGGPDPDAVTVQRPADTELHPLPIETPAPAERRGAAPVVFLSATTLMAGSAAALLLVAGLFVVSGARSTPIPSPPTPPVPAAVPAIPPPIQAVRPATEAPAPVEAAPVVPEPAPAALKPVPATPAPAAPKPVVPQPAPVRPVPTPPEPVAPASTPEPEPDAGPPDEPVALVSIAAEPSSALTVDGVPRGSTPQRFELSIGTHTIRITQGADVHTKALDVTEGPNAYCWDFAADAVCARN